MAAPDRGPPGNYSALLTQAQWEHLVLGLGIDAGDPGAGSDDDSPEAELCRRAAERIDGAEPALSPPPSIPAELDRKHSGRVSTQQASGRFFSDLSHALPEVAPRVVTVSPDLAWSTNLGGWINRVGIWHHGERIDWFADDSDTLVRWGESEHGQHIELGIADGTWSACSASWAQPGRATGSRCCRSALRPLRRTGSRTMVVRDLCRRAVGNPVRGDAGARRRCPPVGNHAIDRTRAAALCRAGAVLRAGPRVGTARRARAAWPAQRNIGLLAADDTRTSASHSRSCPLTRRDASTGVSRCWRAAIACAVQTGGRPWRSSATARRRPISGLGVNDFGQSGDIDDLYRVFGIGAETIVGAALDLVDKGGRRAK